MKTLLLISLCIACCLAGPDIISLWDQVTSSTGGSGNRAVQCTRGATTGSSAVENFKLSEGAYVTDIYIYSQSSNAQLEFDVNFLEDSGRDDTFRKPTLPPVIVATRAIGSVSANAVTVGVENLQEYRLTLPDPLWVANGSLWIAPMAFGGTFIWQRSAADLLSPAWGHAACPFTQDQGAMTSGLLFKIDGYRACETGFFGQDCAGACDCQNGATCEEGLAGTGACTCTPGFYGTNCAGACDCQNGATCDEGVTGTGACNCTSGFYGTNCAGACDCQNGGTCDEGVTGTGACTCASGFSGADCSQENTSSSQGNASSIFSVSFFFAIFFVFSF